MKSRSRILVLILAAALLLGGCASGTSDPEQTVQTTASTDAAVTTEAVPAWQIAPSLQDRALSAEQAFVYDCQTDTFLYLVGDEGDNIYPASITKLFCVYVALQFLEPTQEVTVGDALDLVGYGSSVAKIERGDVLTVEMLVAAMMLPSGNDAAHILAAEAGRAAAKDTSLSASAAVERFMREVNGQLRVKRLKGTHFTNPDGYHDYNHYTNMADLAAMAQIVMTDETLMKYAGMAKLDIQFVSGQTHSWKNTNALLHPESEFYCPYAIGLKTGQTPTAGSCLLSAFEVEGNRYVIGVFGCPEVEDRFYDTLLLLRQIPGIEQ